MSARRTLFAALVAVSSLLAPVAGRASADSTSDQQKLAKIATQLAQLDQQNSQLDDELLGAQQDADQATADVASTQAQIADLQQTLGVIQSHVSALALQTFAGGASSGSLSALLGDPSSLTSSVERDQYTKLVFSDGQDSIDALGAGVDELNKQQAKLLRQQQIAQKKTAMVAAKQADLANRSAALQKLKADTEAQFGKDQVAEAEAAQQDALQQAQAAKARAAEAQTAKAGQPSGAASASGSGAGVQGSGAGGATGATGGGKSGTPPKAPPAGATAPAPTAPTPPKGSSGGSSGAGSGTSGGGHQAPPPSAGASGAVAAALSQVGVPYRYATAVPGVGFDCSGLTSWAWAQAGRSIPHQSAGQYAALPHVSQADVQPGDLLFYYSPISHVAMYIGGGQFVDAPNTGSFVRTGAVKWGAVVGIARP
jgi:peptidoglycan DL-endopeptidase CwlO